MPFLHASPALSRFAPAARDSPPASWMPLLHDSPPLPWITSGTLAQDVLVLMTNQRKRQPDESYIHGKVTMKLRDNITAARSMWVRSLRFLPYGHILAVVDSSILLVCGRDLLWKRSFKLATGMSPPEDESSRQPWISRWGHQLSHI